MTASQKPEPKSNFLSGSSFLITACIWSTEQSTKDNCELHLRFAASPLLRPLEVFGDDVEGRSGNGGRGEDDLHPLDVLGDDEEGRSGTAGRGEDELFAKAGFGASDVIEGRADTGGKGDEHS
jgi:hypothetical protein